MTRIVVPFAVALFTIASWTHGSDDSTKVTGLGLYQRCRGERGAADYCRGMLLGFVMGLSNIAFTDSPTKWTCHGNDETLRLGYTAWAEKNASKLDQEAPFAMMQALLDEGFCKTTSNPGATSR
jgi:hypothetical protein